jgi:hypothetical protein
MLWGCNNGARFEKIISKKFQNCFKKYSFTFLSLIIKNQHTMQTHEVKDTVTTGGENATTENVNATPFTVEAETIEPGQDTGKSIPLDAEKLSAQEIAKLDVNIVNLNAAKEKYAGITIASFEDKENYALVLEGNKFAQKSRIALEKKRVELVAPFVATQKNINAKAKEYGAIIAQIEEPTGKQLEQWKKWEDEEKERVEKEKARVLNERVDSLQAAGMGFNGSFYVIGDTMSMDIASIKAMTPTEFDFFIEKVKLEKQRLDKQEQERLEAQRLEDERKQKEQEELAAKQRELEEQQKKQKDEADRLEKEKEDMRREKLQMREQMAVNAGLTYDPATTAYSFKNKYTEQAITKEQMEVLDNGAFGELIKNVSFVVKTAKENADAEEKKQQAMAQMILIREQALGRLGLVRFEGDDKFSFPINKWLPVDPIEVLDRTIKDTTEAGWNIELQIVTDAVAAAQKLQQQFTFRHGYLLNRGFTQHDNGTYSSEKAGMLIARVTLEDFAKDEAGWDQILQTIADNTDKINKSIARTDARTQQCIDLGLKSEALRFVYDATLFIDIAAIHTHDEAQWEQLLAEVKAEKEKIEALEAETEQTYNDRVDALINLGMKKEGVFVFYNDKDYCIDLRRLNGMDATAWDGIYSEAVGQIEHFKDLAEQEEKRIAAEKEAAKPELEKVANYFAALKAVNVPGVENPKLKETLEHFAVALEAIIHESEAIIQQMQLA